MLYWVNASAGSGKTKAITDRVISLVHAEPQSRVLCVTHTNNATREMTQRIFASVSHAPNIKIQTIHSYCGDILRQFADSVNLPREYKIINDDHEMDMMIQSCITEAISKNTQLTCKFLRRFSLDHLRTSCMNLIKYPTDHTEIEEPEPVNINLTINPIATEDMSNIKHSSGLHDFGASADQIEYARKIINAQPKRGKRLSAAFTEQQIRLKNALTPDIINTDKVFYKNIINIIADAANKKYQLRKAHLGICDFNDIIQQTLNLITAAPRRDEALYTMHKQFRHIVIDEAQDLSKKQWEIIKLIATEMFVNSEGSIFIVGDPKQSIYSFSGADYMIFNHMRAYLTETARRHNIGVKYIELNKSYRSAPVILNFINDVCENIKSSLGHNIIHNATKTDDSRSRVETKEFDNTNDIVDTIMNKIRASLGQPSEYKKRDITPDDIMILVPGRSDFDNKAASALASAGIPYTVSEKKCMSDSPIIADLLAIGRLALDSACKYSITRILLLTGYNLYSTEQIDELIHNDHTIKEIITRIQQMHQTSSRVGVFYVKVMSMFRQYFINRYGDIRQGINLTDLALKSERTHKEFLSFIATYRRHITYTGSSGVRIMTIHGAKGLQAPIVFVVDPFRQNIENNDPDEYYRLFYVAITRSENELYFYYHKNNKEKSWANIITRSNHLQYEPHPQ